MRYIKVAVICASVLSVAGCSKYGVNGSINQVIGDWTQLNLPKGCVAKQIAAEGSSSMAVLCEDGRVFY